jgi:mannitol-1-phosphate 5-dehydrogenase
MEHKSILIFGAGKIGRSFIGQLFSLSGYEVVFVDLDTELVNELNRRKGYPIIIKDEKEERLWISNVRAVSTFNYQSVVEEISNTSLVAVSVGKNELEKILPFITEGLKSGFKKNPDRPLDIILAENMRSAAEFVRTRLVKLLSGDYPLGKLVGLVETSIGKMVPIMSETDLKEDPLLVFAEAYNDLILDKNGFKGPVPKVAGLCPKENIKAWVDRKAFIHNLGHATTAYAGYFYHPDAEFIYDVLTDEKIYDMVRRTMLQSAHVLLQLYPGEFNLTGLEVHIDDLLYRFQNKALKDSLFRVGQDLPRKLNMNDRFAGVIQVARQKSLPYHHILEAMAYGFFFEGVSEKGESYGLDKVFIQMVSQGADTALIQLCGFQVEKDRELIDEINQQYNKLKQFKRNNHFIPG